MIFIKRLVFILDLIAVAIFGSLFIAIVAQTTMRYVFRSPLTLTMEFATIGFIWMTFWVASFGLRINDHLRFDMVSSLFPEQGRRLFGIATNLFFAGVFVIAAQANWEYFEFLAIQRTGSMNLGHQWAFGPYFVFFAIMPLKMALNAIMLMSPRWKERI